MASALPVFPAPPPSNQPISALTADDEVPEPSLEDASTTAQTMSAAVDQQEQQSQVPPAGRDNDERLETLSIHERLVDEAQARSTDTASAPAEEAQLVPPSLEPEVDL